jgi:type IV pilus assembly protein PilC
MALYSFKAKDKNGEVIEDVVQASDKKEVMSLLESDNLQVLTVKSVRTKGSKFFKGSVSAAEKAAFCRFMGTMLRAGLPLPEAIDIIRQESENKKFKQILYDISFNLKKGNTLSSVLSKYKDEFDSVFLTMVKAGEESGTLEKSFDYLGKQLLASYELSQKVKTSMMYPAVIVTAMIGVGIIMLVFVLPQMGDVFLQLNVELPLATRFLLGFGKTVGENVALTMGVLFGLMLIVVVLFLVRTTRQMIFTVFFKLPVIRSVMVQLDTARFARTLSTLLNSGVPIMVSLDVASDVLRQPFLREEAKKFSKGVSKGESLSDILSSIKSKKSFPITMVQTIKAGEKTGSLEVVLEELATFYEMEVDYSLRRATALLEPLLMLVIGIAVGAMVVIMITPIYSIVSGLEGSF